MHITRRCEDSSGVSVFKIGCKVRKLWQFFKTSGGLLIVGLHMSVLLWNAIIDYGITVYGMGIGL